MTGVRRMKAGPLKHPTQKGLVSASALAGGVAKRPRESAFFAVPAESRADFDGSVLRAHRGT